MKETFLNEKPVMALVTIRQSREEIYGSIISREVDTTYSHAVRIISTLEEKGLVESEKKGRKKILELTEQGEKFADVFVQLLDMFEEEYDQPSIQSFSSGISENSQLT